MIITKEQSMAYTEVIEVLKYMPKKEENKTNEIIEYKENKIFKRIIDYIKNLFGKNKQ